MSSANQVLINFILPNGEKIPCNVPVGISVLEAAHQNVKIGKDNLEGACEGSLACSTCHVILLEDEFKKLSAKNKATDDEEDMLDLAFGVKSTSRLGCQIIITPEIEGFTFQIPANSRNNK